MRPGPLFVVGLWRSGTSLLYTLLNQHPQIALMYEGELARLRPLFWIPGGKSDWPARWDFWNGALERHQIASGEIPARVRNLAEAMRVVYQNYAQRKGASVWGCKSPNYYGSVTPLARIFPQAAFIVIWRDPADACRSIIRAASHDTWFRKRGIPHRALFGFERMKEACDQLVRQGVPVHQIQYEDLIRIPAEVMQGICRFLNVPFDGRMTSLDEADRSAIYEGEHHAAVKSEKIVIKKARPEVLPPAQKAKIERYMRFWSRKYGATWPLPSHSQSSDQATPGLFERAKDRFAFRAMRALDAAVIVIYCFVPLALLRRYRAVKGQNQSSSVGREARSAEPISAE